MKFLAPVLVLWVLAMVGCAANADPDARLAQPHTPTPTQSVSNVAPSPATPVPQAVVTATRLPPPQRPVYIVSSTLMMASASPESW